MRVTNLKIGVPVCHCETKKVHVNYCKKQTFTTLAKSM